jgi:hypothetical protein
MNPAYLKHLISQLELVLFTANELGFESSSSHIENRDLTQLLIMAKSAIVRASRLDSSHANAAIEVLSLEMTTEDQILDRLLGIVKSLKISLENGFLQKVEELIHGEMFDDFLEMAEHLWNEGYKDPAAVITGGAIESHLRNLCNKHGIDIKIKTNKGESPKRADQMNNELGSKGGYSKFDQKSVTAWLDLRNQAAHGKFNEYNKDQVHLMILGVRDFIARNPA